MLDKDEGGCTGVGHVESLTDSLSACSIGTSGAGSRTGWEEGEGGL